jgi:nitrite reductase/ring-hydroxylating ferredoxin subunit
VRGRRYTWTQAAPPTVRPAPYGPIVSSLRALLGDLVGDPDVTEPARPLVADAARRCPRGHVVAARDAVGAAVAVVRLSTGEVCVVADRCPHDGGPLSDGFVEADRLVCARHLWEVDPKTGCRVRGRCRS